MAPGNAGKHAKGQAHVHFPPRENAGNVPREPERKAGIHRRPQPGRGSKFLSAGVPPTAIIILVANRDGLLFLTVPLQVTLGTKTPLPGPAMPGLARWAPRTRRSGPPSVAPARFRRPRLPDSRAVPAKLRPVARALTVPGRPAGCWRL